MSVEESIYGVSQSGQEFCEALRDLMAVLETEPTGMIIGGMAVIALGYPRVTTDIDATVHVALEDLSGLLEHLRSHNIVSRIEDPIDFATSHHVLLMRHRPSGIPIDLTLAMLPFEEEALTHRQMIDFSGTTIAIPRVEDLIIYKMVASRPEDLRDVEELLLRYFDSLDRIRVEEVVGQFAALLDRPQMVTQLKELFRLAESS